MFIGHFLQKNPIISGSFAKNDLHFKASFGSSPHCIGCGKANGWVTKEEKRREEMLFIGIQMEDQV